MRRLAPFQKPPAKPTSAVPNLPVPAGCLPHILISGDIERLRIEGVRRRPRAVFAASSPSLPMLGPLPPARADQVPRGNACIEKYWCCEGRQSTREQSVEF